MCKTSSYFDKYCIFLPTPIVENLWKFNRYFGKRFNDPLLHNDSQANLNKRCGKVEIFSQISVNKHFAVSNQEQTLWKSRSRQQYATRAI